MCPPYGVPCMKGKILSLSLAAKPNIRATAAIVTAHTYENVTENATFQKIPKLLFHMLRQV